MKIVLDKKHGNRIEFIGDVSLSFANMLRRYAMSRVPVLAIGNVTFYENSSAFWDEYIAHRLGLMPVTTPEKTPESAEITFTLDADGPKTVHASDITSSDKDITIAKGAIPVVTLGPNQRIRLEGKAVLGIGRKHAKFQAGIMSYGEDKAGLRMSVESFFQMEPYEVLTRGCDIIDADIESIEDTLTGKPSRKKKAEEKAGKAAKKAEEKAGKEAKKAEEKAEKKARKEKEKEEKEEKKKD